MTVFTDWDLAPALQEGLAQQGFTSPTAVQEQAYPLVMEGRDLLVQSRTGTGKTLAFGLPILQRLERGRGPVAALVVLPTRELALQVASALARLARPHGVEVAALYGGGSYRDQHRALSGGARIAVGTPGRLVDHLEKGTLDLSRCTTLVLDEADEILDMGFAEELDRVLAALPAERQTLLFSATLAPETADLAKKTLRNPQTLAVSSGLTAAPEIRHVGYEIFPDTKVDALVNILQAERPELAIVFCHTKIETEKLAERLTAEGFKAAYLNGDLPQATRTHTLNAFRRRALNLLVATDVAARGIDVKGVSHVFNMGVPHGAETYIHRVGRTGRAGATGTAVTFVPTRDALRFRRMLQTAGLTLELLTVPQADTVRARLRERYHEDLTAQLQATTADSPIRALAVELLAYIEPIDLATALLARDEMARALLDAGLDIPVPKARKMNEGREMAPLRSPNAAPARPRDGAAGPPRTTAKGDGVPAKGLRRMIDHQEPGMARIHLNVGKVSHMAPGRLVQLVCSATGLPGVAIGAIEIHPHFTFFDVKEPEAPRVAEVLSGMSYQGKRLRANLVAQGALKT